MRFNRVQFVLGLISLSILVFLLLCPEWQEASGKMPPEYRKEIGRGLLWSPPKTVAAGCYFTYIDCVETPASAFYPVVNRRLVLMQSIPLAILALLLLWLTRTSDRARPRTGYSTTTRVAISLSVASVVPAVGGVPIVIYLFLLPGIISDHGETWQLYAVGVPVFFVVVALAIFGLLSGMHLLARRKTSIRGE